jgi:hypothetical protein
VTSHQRYFCDADVEAAIGAIMRAQHLAVLAILLSSSATLAATPPPPACAIEANRQFDFWVGNWDVYPKANPAKLVAHSRIENLYTGCAIRENWMPLSGGAGGSLSTYVPATGKWRQFWVDASGAAVDFEGGWNGKAMVLEGVWPQPGKPTQRTRMTYTRHADGSVEQLGETSDDNGQSWQPGFDFLYRPAAS